MAVVRKWYVHVRVGGNAVVTLTQWADSIEKALQLSSTELRERFSLTPGGYEFLECGIKEGPDA